MLRKLTAAQAISPLYAEFLAELEPRGFRGDVTTRYADRLVFATDNSVYQFVPTAVIYPRDESDLLLFCSLAAEARHSRIAYSPRGGGTGTNGQSLTEGIVIECTRYMNEIVAVSLEEMWVRVQPGVVLDELNAKLQPHGVFFAPNLSTSNRATLGGMIATDASGEGSRLFGKTSDHVLSLRLVAPSGTLLDLGPIERGDEVSLSGATQALFRELRAIVHEQAGQLATRLPRLQRFTTGYDLAHSLPAGINGPFHPHRLICGAEGTLGLISEAKLKLTRFPKVTQMVVVFYASFDAALRAARELLALDPGSIETIDDKVVGLARHDSVWHKVADFVDDKPGKVTKAINLVEFKSDDRSVVAGRVAQLRAILEQAIERGDGVHGYHVTANEQEAAAMWELRKKAAAFLGNLKGERVPIAFVEDTIVPPENLAAYVRDFRAILDEYGLTYGMFGHVDVGCLHVRPALDMRSPDDEKLLRTISERVAALAQSYGGVLWGEHGRGVRSEFGPPVFGPALYEAMRQIKRAFDPHHQCNPGKIATPSGTDTKLISIDAIKRGTFDRQIDRHLRDAHSTAVACNGNGICFNYHLDSLMCPSAKITGDRLHSPKGRATVMREWLRLVSQHSPAQPGELALPKPSGASSLVALFRGRQGADDFSHEVYNAMNGCLACKACATQCPIKVDVPRFRADFLQVYHTRYRRPLKDYFIAGMELTGRWMARLPGLSNLLLRSRWAQKLLAWSVGIVDPPAFSRVHCEAALAQHGLRVATVSDLASHPPDPAKGPPVVVLQDAVTSFYEVPIVVAACELLRELGFQVIVLRLFENGKGRHIKGFVKGFEKIVRRNCASLRELAKLEIPMVGIDPAVTLTYRDEYAHVMAARGPLGFRVQLLQEFLLEHRSKLQARVGDAAPARTKVRLFGHCTERAFVPTTGKLWQQIFSAAGMEVRVEETGCCGMCGAYGHEEEHHRESAGIFDLSWRPKLASVPDGEHVAVTGHSCRHQLHRQAARGGAHPAELLLTRIRAVHAGSADVRESNPRPLPRGNTERALEA